MMFLTYNLVSEAKLMPFLLLFFGYRFANSLLLLKFLYRQDYRGYLVNLLLGWQEKCVITLLHARLSAQKTLAVVLVCVKTPGLPCSGLKWSSVQTLATPQILQGAALGLASCV